MRGGPRGGTPKVLWPPKPGEPGPRLGLDEGGGFREVVVQPSSNGSAAPRRAGSGPGGGAHAGGRESRRRASVLRPLSSGPPRCTPAPPDPPSPPSPPRTPFREMGSCSAGGTDRRARRPPGRGNSGSDAAAAAPPPRGAAAAARRASEPRRGRGRRGRGPTLQSLGGGRGLGAAGSAAWGRHVRRTRAPPQGPPTGRREAGQQP